MPDACLGRRAGGGRAVLRGADTANLREQMRLACSARGNAITVVERRAPWNRELGAEWTTTHVAQLRHDPANATWSLHWRGSDDRWHSHDRVKPTSDIRRLLAEIDADPTGIFWG